MEEETSSSVPVIAGVFGLVALALTILGALVFVDHINIAGTNQASVQQQQPPSSAPAAPSPPEKKN